MKGIILDQFVAYIRDHQGFAACEALLQSVQLPSKAAYTSVGTYSAAELETMVSACMAQRSRSRAEILIEFGEWVFPRLAARYAAVLGNVSSTFELLRILDGVIHVEVRKLYPDAELPSFKVSQLRAEELEVRYRSTRRLEDLADGLMRGAAVHFKESIRIERRDGADEVVFNLRHGT